MLWLVWCDTDVKSLLVNPALLYTRCGDVAFSTVSTIVNLPGLHSCWRCAVCRIESLREWDDRVCDYEEAMRCVPRNAQSSSL